MKAWCDFNLSQSKATQKCISDSRTTFCVLGDCGVDLVLDLVFEVAYEIWCCQLAHNFAGCLDGLLAQVDFVNLHILLTPVIETDFVSVDLSKRNKQSPVLLCLVT